MKFYGDLRGVRWENKEKNALRRPWCFTKKTGGWRKLNSFIIFCNYTCTKLQFFFPKSGARTLSTQSVFSLKTFVRWHMLKQGIFHVPLFITSPINYACEFSCCSKKSVREEKKAHFQAHTLTLSLGRRCCAWCRRSFTSRQGKISEDVKILISWSSLKASERRAEFFAATACTYTQRACMP